MLAKDGASRFQSVLIETVREVHEEEEHEFHNWIWAIVIPALADQAGCPAFKKVFLGKCWH